MALIVQKYGGSSVADAEKIKNVARRVAKANDEGNQVVVVVSAMGDTTDDLVKLAYQISEQPTDREFDDEIRAALGVLRQQIDGKADEAEAQPAVFVLDGQEGGASCFFAVRPAHHDDVVPFFFYHVTDSSGETRVIFND